MDKITTIGLDIAKTLFHAICSIARGTEKTHNRGTVAELSLMAAPGLNLAEMSISSIMLTFIQKNRS